MKTVNKPFRKKDAMQLVTGQPVYMDDIIPQDCLIVKLLRSPHANAIVRSINTAVAKKVPGIEAVFTWEDVPQDARRYTQAGQTYPEASPYDRLLIDRHVRFVGDVVAIVAGKDEKCVDKALKLIKVDYEVLEATRQMVLMEHGEVADDLYLHTLKAAQIQEEEYFGHLVAGDLSSILRDIREEHRTDALTADDDLSAAAVQKQLMEAVHFEGSSEEKKIRAYLATLGIDYDTLTKEEFVSLIGILKKSKHMKSPISQRGKTTMTHGKGKRKKR